MDSWWIFFFVFLLSLTSPFLIKLLLSLLQTTTQRPNNKQLPPGPPYMPIITRLGWHSKSVIEREPILRNFYTNYGPIVTLYITSKPAVFVLDRDLAHLALIHHGAAFSDRPPSTASNRIFSSKHHIVTSAHYGPLWRQLRRNLSSGILHPSRTKYFAGARKSVLRILIDELKSQAESNQGVVVVTESFQFAMYSLLALMCFGEKLEVEKIREIKTTQKLLHRSFRGSQVFAFLPNITKLVFRKRWKTLLEIQQKQEDLYISLIRARARNEQKGLVSSYVDSLLELYIPKEEGGGERRLTEGEMVSLCSEFMSAGTETTASALEWTMAEIVKNQELQKLLVEEIGKELQADEEDIKEEELQKMSYLKAVILEGLRRHPPAHYVAPHAVTEEVEIGGYVITKKAYVNFAVAEMGWDEKVWKEPMEFRPERFLAGGEGEGVDITGSREIKMMPFGVGRRICPGLGLAMLHLEYFVANLVREFEWESVEGKKVDFTEGMELAVVKMKNHLRAGISPRRGRLGREG